MAATQERIGRPLKATKGFSFVLTLVRRKEGTSVQIEGPDRKEKRASTSNGSDLFDYSK